MTQEEIDKRLEEWNRTIKFILELGEAAIRNEGKWYLATKYYLGEVKEVNTDPTQIKVQAKPTGADISITLSGIPHTFGRV